MTSLAKALRSNATLPDKVLPKKPTRGIVFSLYSFSIFFWKGIFILQGSTCVNPVEKILTSVFCFS